MPTPCVISDCERPSVGRGLCDRHYYGAKRDGTLDEIAPKRFDPCEHCGASIDPARRFGARFCTRSCLMAAREQARRDEVDERLRGRTCAACGGPILSRSGKAKCCSKACSVRYHNEHRQQLRRERWEATDPRCKGCDASLASCRIGVAFCSPRCKSRVHGAIWRERAPGYMRQYLYGLTPEAYEAMLASQGSRCAMCQKDAPGGKGLHVDHDHATGEVRGLLCQRCNLTLGHANDDPAWMRAAIAYLERR